MIRRALFLLCLIPVGIAAMLMWVIYGGDRGDKLLERFDRWGT